MDPEAVERLSPAARIEVADVYARRFLAWATPHNPERRRAMKIRHHLDGRLVRTWLRPWNTNLTPAAAQARQSNRKPSTRRRRR